MHPEGSQELISVTTSTTTRQPESASSPESLHVRGGVSYVVTLQRFRQFLRITPPVPELSNYLYTALQVRGHDDAGNSSIIPVRDALVRDIGSPGVHHQLCLAGSLPILVELLESLGYSARITGKPLAQLPEPNLEQLDKFKPVDAGLLHFVHTKERGLIRYNRSGKVSAARLIAQIARAWPKKRIVIVATRIAEARRLARTLRLYLPSVGLLTSRNNTPLPARRVVVATPSRLGMGEIGIERRHIFIAMNPAELFSGFMETGLDCIRAAWKARMYGLLAVDELLSPRQRDQVESLFGTDEVLIPRHGHRPLPVAVVIEKITGGERLSVQKEPAIKQQGVYRHPVRNRRIQRLAQLLASSDKAGLLAQFPKVAANVGGMVGRVAVLVDTVEHGLRLGKMLGWPVVVAADVITDGLNADELELIKQGHDQQRRTRDHVVVTYSGLDSAGEFDILVRADGGVGTPAIPRSKLSVPCKSTHRMLLIDFRDEHHPVLRRWSKQRRMAYVEADWSVVGEEERSPLWKFLDSRPEVCRE